ncbi:AAA family ATPase [Lacipirellula limnantheis]|uniref:Holliday junction ATP-dependent DNA helicase RuvB n=1 Tax=Lacipirellula limnantheis TaxID=2528024 RepID=A0A517TTL5_9BACT|nr:MoxR family ATPase [Lacipirellula limnantheis]QDT71703.1 Holliday junction ATP-dependent DNA helicase RuvB [Lacipirellula limnantheis]
MTTAAVEAEQAAERFVSTFRRVRDEMAKFIVGQQDVVEHVLLAVVSGGHVLLEGVPGLGKTALVNTLAQALHLKFQRIQFTPDLLPADVVGTQVLVDRNGHKSLEFQQGPVFCNVLLADEINRATPKTQSALLETMQEKSVTVAGRTHRLDLPFFVLATQNPIEQEGTYPLPEAQLDRFFFKLFVELPGHDEFAEILRRTGGAKLPTIDPVATGEEILEMGRTLRETPIDDAVQDHLIRVVRATHPTSEDAPAEVRKFVRHGASPRGAQAILAASRGRALLAGRYHVSREDVDAVAAPALRHRMILSFEGEAEGVKADDLIEKVIEKVD